MPSGTFCRKQQIIPPADKIGARAAATLIAAFVTASVVGRPGGKQTAQGAECGIFSHPLTNSQT